MSREGLPGAWEGLRRFLLKNEPQSNSSDLTRRILLLYGISSLGAVLLFLLGFVAFFQGAYLLSTFDFIASGFLACLLIATHFRGYHSRYMSLGVGAMYALYLYLFVSGGVKSTAFMWHYTFPMFAHFLLGPKRGLQVSLALFIPSLAFLVFDISSPDSQIYSFDFALRFAPSFLCVTLFAYMYERSRDTSYKGWIQIQSNLESLVNERTESLTQEVAVRKERERALKQSEHRLSLALKGAKCGLWDWHVSTNELYFDPNYFRLAGFEPNEFSHDLKEWLERVHPDDVDRVKEAIREYLAGKTDSYQVEYRFKSKSGEWIWLLGQGEIVARDEEGHPARFSGLQFDITERKQGEEARLDLEERLQHKMKMEAIGVLAGGVAHNFNNNLSILLGNVELAEIKLTQGKSADSFLKNAKTAIMRSRDLVDQLLIYSRKGTHIKDPVFLSEVVEETVRLLSPTLPKEIVLQESIAEESREYKVEIEVSQVQESLINLCRNSLDAMNGSGLLRIVLDVVALDERNLQTSVDMTSGRYLKLSVQDDGCGMSEELVSRIFDPFFTTKKVGEGTGMGLSTVQGIVEQHGGMIKVNSTPGLGSSFNLYFPALPSEEPSADEAVVMEQELPCGMEQVLVVDDEEMLLGLTELMLQEVGYRVTTEISSQRALETFLEDPYHFDLVITDQTMPEMNGIDLIHEMLMVRSDLPTILYSGYNFQVDEKEAADLGICAFLMKPLNRQELLKAARLAIDEGATQR